MEHEPFENAGLIAEIAGTPLKEVPITVDQQMHLAVLDADIAVWIEDIDRANEKQRAFKEYVARTHDYKNYDHTDWRR